MPKNPKNEPIIEFIVAKLDRAQEPGRILAGIGRKWPDRKISERTFRRLHAEAKEIHAAKWQKIREDEAAAAIAAAQEQKAGEIVDLHARKIILSNIARGFNVFDVEGKPDEGPNQVRKPVPPKLRLDAIDLLNKMEAVYVTRIKDETPPEPIIFDVGPPPAEGSQPAPGTDQTPG